MFGPSPTQSPAAPAQEQTVELPPEYGKMQSAFDEVAGGLHYMELEIAKIENDPNTSPKRKAELKAEKQEEFKGKKQGMIDYLIKHYTENLNRLDSRVTDAQVRSDAVGQPMSDSRLTYHQNKLTNGYLKRFANVQSVAEWYERAEPEAKVALQDHWHLVEAAFPGQANQRNVEKFVQQLKRDEEQRTANPELDAADEAVEMFISMYRGKLERTAAYLDGYDVFYGPFSNQNHNRDRIAALRKPRAAAESAVVGTPRPQWDTGLFG